MGRPPKQDRASVGSETLTLRLTPEDRVTLDGLVAAKAAELEQDGLDMTAAAYVRGLIRREGRRVFGDEKVSSTIIAKPITSVARSPQAHSGEDPRSPARTNDKHVRVLFNRALAKGVAQKEIARVSGVSASNISRWKNGSYELAEGALGKLSKALESFLRPPDAEDKDSH